MTEPMMGFSLLAWLLVIVGLVLLLGFGTPTVWGVVMAFCSLLPVVGSALVWLPAAIWLLFEHRPVAAVLLALWGALIVVLMVAAMLPYFIGLIVLGPVVGHATWHAYREVWGED